MHAIRLLKQAVETINFAFAKLNVKEIDEIFGGKMFFETVLGYEEEDQVPKQHLQMAAAYLPCQPDTILPIFRSS
jgi:hypothetical protein